LIDRGDVLPSDFSLHRASELIAREQMGFPVDWDSEDYVVTQIAQDIKTKKILEGGKN